MKNYFDTRLKIYHITVAQFFRENEVYERLQEYIRRASGLAERKEHLIEVCVLFVQCMEVYK